MSQRLDLSRFKELNHRNLQISRDRPKGFQSYYALVSAVCSVRRAVCAESLVKWGVKVSEVTSCKAIINLKIFEALKHLTLHDLIYSYFFISSNSLVYLLVHT